MKKVKPRAELLPRRVLSTPLDKDPGIRKGLTERLLRLAQDERIPVVVLHQMIGLLELHII